MASHGSTFLGGLSPEAFLADYWQQRPLLVRGALPNFASPVSPDDLAELAGLDEVTSRLVLERGGEDPWEVHYGPFDPDVFDDLPETHWTLLVQEADRYVPEVAALLEHVRFVPNWRIDDVMISYAPTAGGVGPHIDNYDVFLVQARGRRRWQINHTPVAEEHLVPDLDVRMLADFEPDAEWVLEPGDLLYLPPRIAHNGISEGDCMTYSIGFRAPSTPELLEHFLGFAIEAADPDERFRDPGRTLAVEPGLIDTAERRRIQNMLRELLADEAALDRWLGRYLTEPKRGFLLEPHTLWEGEALCRAILDDGLCLRRRAIAELAYIPVDDEATLFAAGAAYELDHEHAFLAPLLTGCAPLDASTLGPHLGRGDVAELLADLVNTGVLVADDAGPAAR